MRKSMMSLAIAVAATVFTAANASAQSNTPGVDWRQDNQAQRIFNGIQNGHLNHNEAGQLILGQVRIHNKERRFKADGVVTPSERFRLHRAQNRQSRRIYRKKHN